MGYKPYVQAIARLIANQEQLPITIGIYGPWGSGKTSFMNFLKESLEKDNGIKTTVWFDAWKYDRKDALWNAFIQTILKQIPKRQRLQSRLKKLGTMAAEAAVAATLSGASGGVLGVTTVKEIKKTFESDFYDYIEKFEGEFSKLVDMYVGKNANGKLVVFIDDLDRCLPENAITVLESLKLFLGKGRCVFVMGVDRGALERAVDSFYGVEKGLPGRDYLAKIVQMPFHLPLADRSTSVDAAAPWLDPKGPIGASAGMVVELATQGNPRLIKRFNNSFVLATNTLPLFGELNHEEWFSLVAVGTAIFVRFPALHEACRNDPWTFQTAWRISQGTNPRELENELRNGACEDFIRFIVDDEQKYYGNDVLNFIRNLKGVNDPISNAEPKDLEAVFRFNRD